MTLYNYPGGRPQADQTVWGSGRIILNDNHLFSVLVENCTFKDHVINDDLPFNMVIFHIATLNNQRVK